MNWERPGIEELNELVYQMGLRLKLHTEDEMTDAPIGNREWRLILSFIEAIGPTVDEVQKWRAAGRSGYSLPCIRGEALQAVEAFLDAPNAVLSGAKHGDKP